MNKSFEKEYQYLASHDVPDLWDRIESKLTDKSIHPADKEEVDDTQETMQKEPRKKNVFSYVQKYAGVLIAAVCFIMIIPVALLIGKNSSTKSVAPKEQAESYALTEEAQPEPEPMLMQAEEEVVLDRAIPEETKVESQKESENFVADDAEECMPMPALVGEMETKRATIETGTTWELSVMVRQQVKVSVTEEGTIYAVSVEVDETNTFAVGEEISLLLPLDSSWLLEEGKSYHMTITYDQTKEDVFIIQQVSQLSGDR